MRDSQYLWMIISCISLTVLPLFFSGDIAWDIQAMSGGIQTAILAAASFWLIPYTRLRLKSLFAVFAFFSIFDVALYPIRYLLSNYLCYGIEIGALLIFTVFIHNKIYLSTSDKLDSKGLFFISARFTSTRDFILSLFSPLSVGGIGLYANGHWYKYSRKHKKLIKIDGEILNKTQEKYLTKRIRNFTQTDLDKLESLVGSKWSITNNCITKLHPFLSEV